MAHRASIGLWGVLLLWWVLLPWGLYLHLRRRRRGVDLAAEARAVKPEDGSAPVGTARREPAV